ncbi:HD domain-containing phosphohydrolase [Celerinatantimonas sp. MCCC 1A17872]|uniref:HD-GYP domain-containing protein n=1 Tax=Celerinatantimonas sp. MCCC 1A17872 TaxID=3177514 RepID=UPI0038C8A8F9
MVQNMDLNVDLRQMVIALETAVSLVGMNDTNHGKRVGYIASQIGSQLGFSQSDISFAFELGMLHDCGVSNEQMHSNLVNHFDWSDAYIHCNIGYQLLKNFAPLSKYALPILYHHTPWQLLSSVDISSYDRRMSNLIFLSDRIDVLGATHDKADILLAKDDIIEAIKAHEDSYFQPKLVDAFLAISNCESFWIALEDRHIFRFVCDMANLPAKQQLSLDELKQLSLIMAYIVDQKSPFTAQHSVRVAAVAKFLAISFGLTPQQCQKIEIAGLLHDLGKLHTPDRILDKPGALDDVERAVMNQHSYETYEILRAISGLEEIARWAAFHHEGLNQAGYPFHPRKQDLTIEARIIAVADVFQALVQHRPYRKGMSCDAALILLDKMVASGKLDAQLVSLVRERIDPCYVIAQHGDPDTESQLTLLQLPIFSDVHRLPAIA